jgi:hypothetical protein
MKWRPQFRLRTLFLLVFCAAVGLAAKGLMYPIYTAMVVGLAQQINELRLQRDPPGIGERSLSFAISFAIGWRFVLAALLSFCIVFQLLFVRKILQDWTRQDLFLSTPPDYDVVAQVCAIVVFSNSISRWEGPRLDARHRSWATISAWIAGAALAAIVLPHVAMIHFLVHIATQGIESAIPAAFNRTGVFPDQRAQGFRLFWLSVASGCSIVLAAATLSNLSGDHPRSRRRQGLTIAMFLVLLPMPCVFCIWYFTREFQRISPDLASVHFVGTWPDWLGAATLGTISVTVQAYRLAIAKQPRVVIATNLHDGGDLPFHESVPSLLYLGGLGALFLFGTVRDIGIFKPMYGTASVGELVAGLLQYLPFYLLIALSVLSLQLCWMRWRHRSAPTAWELVALPPRRFFSYWLALALLAIVGLTTISIYCFVFWLGPWYLKGQ